MVVKHGHIGYGGVHMHDRETIHGVITSARLFAKQGFDLYDIMIIMYAACFAQLVLEKFIKF